MNSASPQLTTPPGVARPAGVVLAGVAMLATLVLGNLTGFWSLEYGDFLLWTVVSSFFITLGALILWKGRGNRVGYIFSAMGLFILGAAIAGELADSGVVALLGLSSALWLGWIGLLGLLVLWFPSGQVPGSRWLWLQWLGVLLTTAFVVMSVLAGEVCATTADNGNRCIEWLTNPVGISWLPNPEYGWIAPPLLIASLVFFAMSLVSLGVRYRRAGQIERLQLKWFMLASTGLVIVFVAEPLFEAGGQQAPVWLDVIAMASVIGVPVAATLAVLRYRLYDIDRIISRTVSYVLIVGLLAAVFAIGVMWIPMLFDLGDSSLLVAASTLAVAALFNPIRRRVQTRVDRRFNRARYDAERVAESFASSLRDRVDPGGVLDGWLGVVSETMEPTSAGAWVKS